MALAAAAVAALCWWMGLFDREPSFQGRTATEWLEPGLNGESQVAFRAMGPKGVLFLARILEAKPHQLPASVERFIEKVRLPKWANPALKMEEASRELTVNQQTAYQILFALGRDGAPAIPTLARMFHHAEGGPDGKLWDVTELLTPLAGQLEFMTPELIQELRQHASDEERVLADMRLLAAIGPKAKEAVPILRQISQSALPSRAPRAARAAVALWNIARETNELIRVFSNALQWHNASAQFALHELERAVPPPKPLEPVLEQFLRHPAPWARRQAGTLLEELAPGRLRQIVEELNSHQASLLQEHLKLLESTNYLDRYNALSAIQFMGPEAAGAVPRLGQILLLGKPMNSVPRNLVQPPQFQPPQYADVNETFRAISAIGPQAAALTPALMDFLQTNAEMASSVLDALASIGGGANSALPALRSLLATNNLAATPTRGRFGRRRSGPLPAAPAPAPPAAPGLAPDPVLRFQVARATASMGCQDSNVIAILREAEASNARHPSSYFPADPDVARLSACVALWKAGLETNPPVDELIADLGSYNHSVHAVDLMGLLGDIGPPARKALPMLEKNLKARTYSGSVSRGAALAICKIDPEEARRLGLPGLWIICPDHQ